ncbi:MAG TPA: hypothetical protein VH518_18800, partial [Tepidisphaeraceae bacterium]
MLCDPTDPPEQMMSNLSRREFVTRTSTALAAAAALGEFVAVTSNAAAQDQKPPATQPAPRADGAVELHWLEGAAPAFFAGATLGVPWPMGAFKKDQTFVLKDAKDQHVPMESWPIGYWPDGSLKWTAHAVSPAAAASGNFALAAGVPLEALKKMAAMSRDTGAAIEIDTGGLRYRISKTGSNLIDSIERGEKAILKNARLICLLPQQEFTSEIE